MVASTLAPTKESYEEIRQRNIAATYGVIRKLIHGSQQIAVYCCPYNSPAPGANPQPHSDDRDERTDENSKTRAEKKRRKSTRREAEQAAEGEGDEKPQEEAGSRRRSGRIQKLQARKQNKLAGVEDERSEGSEESEDEYDDQDGPDGGDSSDGSESKEISRKRKSTWKPPSGPKRPRGSLPPQRKAKSLKGHRPNPKIFGQQVGTEVGDWWDSRMLCSQAGVHAPPVCGIAGSDGVGCYSVALSGGYEDDVDLGYAFTFTGSGGRALSGTKENPKNLRTAPQSSDQEFTAMNASVRLSCELKNPVRVIRGFKNHSPFAPESGYRYDGLYRVEKAWREAGQSGFQVCKPKIPVKPGREAEAEQILRDMGIATEELLEIVAQTQEWTQKLAKQRIEEQRRQRQCATEAGGADGKDEQPEETADPDAEGPVKAVADAATEDPVETSKLTPSPQNTQDVGSSSLEPERCSDKPAEPNQPVDDQEAHPAAPRSPKAVPDEPAVLSSVEKTGDEADPPSGEESATKTVDDGRSALETDLGGPERVASLPDKHSASKPVPEKTPSATVPLVESLDKEMATVASDSEVVVNDD
ncbi:uncharacterized protein PGTG_12990 [Puccinia graminis f. sp. tritici CRL 75-36-700-3]|uniref:YDG domain-containing protein n=1 Tax=Puccinia graminis f. sp. tritici (strain CRL 75-36-700-3 / race SCCL) TaxID=418459 RepID=E3KQN3_PUCGT|nr:uncharacterized protein PGTG_12990 [Puccinia graminis f. sp. tritici CRL 75-36-700-3]EFP86608.2 hypothetical protein PGTG_12990 [Puccinia graminis f. sp. tritici CRL 75-36-700-3]